MGRRCVRRSDERSAAGTGPSYRLDLGVTRGKTTLIYAEYAPRPQEQQLQAPNDQHDLP